MNRKITIESEHAIVTLLPCNDYYINKPSFNSLKDILEKEKLNLQEYFVLDDLRLKSTLDFGKGYGKEMFIRVIKSYPNLIFTPSFSTFENEDMESFAGREKMTMKNLHSAPKKLMENFYKKILNKESIPYKVIYDKKYIIITNP